MTSARFDPQISRQILKSLDRFIAERLDPAIAEMDGGNRFPRALFEAFAELGLLQLWVPEDQGGLGPAFALTLTIVERLARSSPAFATGVANFSDCLSPILGGGDAALKERLLPALMGGAKVPAFCLSEPGGGSDVAAMAATALATPDGYLLRGRKCWITNAEAADIFVVFAKTDVGLGHRGISAFVVPRDAAGLTVMPAEDLLSLRGSPVSEVVFSDVLVGRDMRLGSEGDGFGLAMRSLDAARLQIAAICLGLAARAIETIVAFTADRRSFGEPLIKHQGIQFKLADLVTGLAEKRALFHAAVQAHGDAGQASRVRLYSAMTKLACSDLAMQAASEAVQLLGAQGLTKAYAVERLFRDAKALQILEGANEIQRWLIGRSIERHLDFVQEDSLLVTA
ncbi:MAG: acyl-CoA dehydrogenase family protein [Parvibaculaceae bacterium]